MRVRHSIYLAYLHTLAFALLAIGIILLIDNPAFSGQASGVPVLVPSGAPIALLIGFMLLGAINRSWRIALLFAGVLFAVAFYGLAVRIPDGIPGTVSLPAVSPIRYSLALVLILVAAAMLCRRWGSYGSAWGRGIGVLICAIGALSLLSILSQPAVLMLVPGWQALLTIINLGTGPDITLNTSVLVVLLGIGIFLLNTAPEDPPQRLDRATLFAGVIGTIFTCLGWHLMHLHNMETTRNRSDVLLASVQHMVGQQRQAHIDLIHRIAERWLALDQLPLGPFWRQEAQSHLRDFANLKLLGVLDDQLRPTAVVAKSLEGRAWLHRFLEEPERREWLRHTLIRDEPHMSRSIALDTGTLTAVIAAPLRLPGRGSWLVVASIDVEAIVARYIHEEQSNLVVQVLEGEQVLYKSSASEPGSLVQVGEAGSDYHHDSSWRIVTYLDRQGALMWSAFLPPLVLLFGLGLTFLLMVSQRLGWLSNERSRHLDEANLGLKTSLAQQSRLRSANELIMQYSKDILCSFNNRGRFTQVSQGCREVLGYEPEELIGESFAKHIVPDDYAETQAASARVMQGSGVINFRNRYRRKDGSIAHLMWSAGWSKEEQEMLCVGRDITLMVDAERLLNESEQRYRSLFTFNPDPVYSLDLEGRFQSMNQAGLTLLGYSESELLGKDFSTLLIPTQLCKTNRHFASALEGLPQHYETQCQTRSGQILDLEITNLPIIIDDRVVGIFGIAKDVTARKRMAQAVHERDQFFTLSLDMFCTVDFEGHFVQVNQAFTRVLGFSADHLVNSPYTDLIAREDQAKVRRAVERLREGHLVHNLEVQALDSQGAGRWLELNATTGDDGVIYCAARDITQRRLTDDKLRESAERLTVTFESITDALFTLDRDWRFTYINAESERLLGRDRGELLGKVVWEEFREAVGTTFDLRYRQALAENRSVEFEEYYPPLGRWLSVSAYPSNDGLTVYYRDVSERKVAEETLQNTLKELADSNRELENFAFVASHDLQEPLRKIQAFGERLQTHSESFDGPRLDDKSRDYIQRMSSAAQRMQALIRDLLSYSRISTHKEPFITLDLNRILAEVLDDLEAPLKDSGADVTSETLPSILGEPTQIRQVFQNLLSNAVKFRQTDALPRIQVYAEKKGPESWTLCVSDNGIGFDEKYLDRIFDPFQRLHSRQAYPGTGIGLAIVAKILERHGATITATSTPGTGTTFRITFFKKNQQRDAK